MLGPEFDVQGQPTSSSTGLVGGGRCGVVLDGSEVRYGGSEETLVDFFTEVHSERAVDCDRIRVDSELLFPDSARARESGVRVLRPVTQKEVSSRLGRMSNSAPGKDRLGIVTSRLRMVRFGNCGDIQPVSA